MSRPDPTIMKYIGFIVLAVVFLGISLLFFVSTQSSNKVEDIQPSRIKPTPRSVKAVYLTAASAQNADKRLEIINLINATELNAVVIDIKDYSGYIQFYPTDHVESKEVWIAKPVIKNISRVIQDFHDYGIYVIARQVVFQDPAYASVFPESAVKNLKGDIWRDRKGLAWVDPTVRSVWEYNSRIAKVAIAHGFDEINFDYIRFPSDGDMSTVRYADELTSHADTMRDFFQFLDTELRDEPAYSSFDVFGMTLDNDEFDLHIGQRIKDMTEHADYISPMMYPSHYPSLYLGYENPSEHPYEVITHGLSLAQHHFTTSTRATLRPWLQAFNIGAIYDGEKIRAQINAVEEAQHTSGFMLWNARNVYSRDGLLPSRENDTISTKLE